MFLISELAGEQRFASVVARRLESLGALTHGDRRATESRDLSKYNVDTKVGMEGPVCVCVCVCVCGMYMYIQCACKVCGTFCSSHTCIMLLCF